MIEYIQTAMVEHPSINKIVRGGIAVLAIGSLIGPSLARGEASGATVSAQEQTTPRPEQEPPVTTTTTLVPKTCITPSGADVATVKKIFATPENPGYKKIDSMDADSFQGLAARERAEFKLRQEAAKKTGVTVFDYFGETQGLRRDDSAEKLPYTKFLSVARQFARHYGVNIEMATAGDTLGYGGQQPTRADLETDSTKNVLLGITDNLGEMPLEYERLSGLKTIKLMAHSQVGAYVFVAQSTDTLFIDISQPLFSPRNYAHEEYHLLDAKTCGDDWFVDQNFRALNGREIYDQRHPSPSIITLANFDNYFTDADRSVLEHADRKKQKALFCRTSKKYFDLASQVVSNTDYALTHVVEDKAELGADIANPALYAYDLHPDSPILARKFGLLLARLYVEDPRVVRYYGEVSRRPKPTGYRVGCP